MAAIEKRGKGYRTAAAGSDMNGKQIRCRHLWVPDEKLTLRQAERDWNRQIVRFKEQVKNSAHCQRRKYSFCRLRRTDYDGLRQSELEAHHPSNYKWNLVRINQAIGYIKRKDLTILHIQAFYRSLQAQGVRQHTAATATICSCHRTTSSILEKGRQVADPSLAAQRRTRSIRPRRGQKARYLDEPDAKRMLQLLQEEPIKWRAPIIFDLLSGLRRAKLLGQHWQDVDTPKAEDSNHYLKVSRTAILILLEYKS